MAVADQEDVEQIERDLAAVARRQKRAQAVVDESAKQRDELIHAALAAGIKRSRIIGLTGLSSARVEQIRRRTH